MCALPFKATQPQNRAPAGAFKADRLARPSMRLPLNPIHTPLPIPFTVRYFIRLSYDGAAYHGWQVQPNALSVQEALQQALTTLLQKPIPIVGAGRTDTAVNAHFMMAHFDHEAELPTRQLTYRLNKILPPDIAVQRIMHVTPEAHARFSATARTYHYHIYQNKNPFYRRYATLITTPLDFKRMNEAAELLLNTTDFTSFSKLHTDAKTNICQVTQACWTEVEPGLWRFTITANRFLRNMVRAIVGTLIEVGRGKIDMEEFQAIISRKDRQQAGQSMPGHALSLVDIRYPAEIFLNSDE